MANKSSTRQWAQKKLDMAVNGIENVGNHCNEFVHIYEKFHPEISQPVVIAMELLTEVEILLENVRKSF